MHIKTPVYLGISTTKLSKILMYELWYDYVKQKRGKKVKLCYVDTDNFILYIKTDDIFTLQKMLKLHLILQIINQIDHCLKYKTEKNCIKERQIGWKYHYKIYWTENLQLLNR